LFVGITEDNVSTDLLRLFQKSANSFNIAHSFLEHIEESFQQRNNSINVENQFEDIGVLIHLFHSGVSSAASPSSSLTINMNSSRRPIDGELNIDEVEKFIRKNHVVQNKRDLKMCQSAINHPHICEEQLQRSTIEPFVRLDVYENLLAENETLRQANDFITELLYTQPTNVLDKTLNDYLRANPSLNF
jgi:hypothetical protein